MNENTKGILFYGALMAVTLTGAFMMVSQAQDHETITVNQKTREITDKVESHLAAPYYSDMHTVTTVFNLGRETKTTTDSRLTTSGIVITDDSKTKTGPLTPDDLFDLQKKSPEAAALINICHANLK